jgi:ACS family tartrate transporter-like MFS transporter
MSSATPDEIGRSALRKASLRLVPLIGLGYGLAYMDRINISFASLRMNLDLGFSPVVYGTGAGVFFVAYALCEVPSNLLLVRFGARRWLARIMFTWGLIAIGMMFVRTAPHFYVMRFLLGMAEAGFFPGVVFYLTQWFPPEYRARTISRFYIALPLSSTVMGSIAASLLALNGRLHLAGWQWLFLVEGLPPLLLSFVFLTQLPDKPSDAPWLAPPECAWLEARLTASEAHSVSSPRLGDDLRTALTDLRVWLLGLFFLCILTVLYGWSFSAPAILIQLTHVSVGQAGAIIAIMGLLGAAAMLLNAGHSDRSGERILHIAIPCLIMGAAFALGALTRQPVVAILAFTVTVVCYNAAQGPVLALPSTFLSGRASAIGYAAIVAIGIPGGVIGPIWMGWARQLTGDYQRGLLTLAIPCIFAAALVFLLAHLRPAKPHPATKLQESASLDQN